ATANSAKRPTWLRSHAAACARPPAGPVVWARTWEAGWGGLRWSGGRSPDAGVEEATMGLFYPGELTAGPICPCLRAFQRSRARAYCRGRAPANALGRRPVAVPEPVDVSGCPRQLRRSTPDPVDGRTRSIKESA